MASQTNDYPTNRSQIINIGKSLSDEAAIFTSKDESSNKKDDREETMRRGSLSGQKPHTSAQHEEKAQEDKETPKLDNVRNNRLNGKTTTQQQINRSNPTLGKFFSVHISGSLDFGFFDGSYNDIYVKYSTVAGPDWILSSGVDLGITQISRFRIDKNGAKRFIWNQPICLSYKSYNFYGWPQIVFSVFSFDSFGNDQLLGYGTIHLPIYKRLQHSPKRDLIKVYIHSPQASSYMRQLSSWLTGKKPELINPETFARADCRKLFQMVTVGTLEIGLDLITKDVTNNQYNTGQYNQTS